MKPWITCENDISKRFWFPFFQNLGNRFPEHSFHQQRLWSDMIFFRIFFRIFYNHFLFSVVKWVWKLKKLKLCVFLLISTFIIFKKKSEINLRNNMCDLTQKICQKICWPIKFDCNFLNSGGKLLNKAFVCGLSQVIQRPKPRFLLKAWKIRYTKWTLEKTGSRERTRIMILAMCGVKRRLIL